MARASKRVESFNVAEAKRQLSALIGRVAFGNESVIITRRGKPMARLVPVEPAAPHLADVSGWLEDDDPFFDEVDDIVAARANHTPRVVAAGPPRPKKAGRR